MCVNRKKANKVEKIEDTRKHDALIKGTDLSIRVTLERHFLLGSKSNLTQFPLEIGEKKRVKLHM